MQMQSNYKTAIVNIPTNDINASSDGTASLNTATNAAKNAKRVIGVRYNPNGYTPDGGSVIAAGNIYGSFRSTKNERAETLPLSLLTRAELPINENWYLLPEDTQSMNWNDTVIKKPSGITLTADKYVSLIFLYE